MKENHFGKIKLIIRITKQNNKVCAHVILQKPKRANSARRSSFCDMSEMYFTFPEKRRKSFGQRSFRSDKITLFNVCFFQKFKMTDEQWFAVNLLKKKKLMFFLNENQRVSNIFLTKTFTH